MPRTRGERVSSESVNAGPDRCALARLTEEDGSSLSLQSLEHRLRELINWLIHQPVPGCTEASGPSLITYSALVQTIHVAMYDAIKLASSCTSAV